MARRKPKYEKPQRPEGIGVHSIKLDPEDEYLREKCYIRYSTIYRKPYAYLSREKQPLHRVLMGSPVDMEVDHMNGNTLDNRKCNLRAVSRKENSRNVPKHATNTSGFKGATFRRKFRPEKSWLAYVWHNGSNVDIGRFPSREDANKARLRWEKEHWGVQPRRIPDFLAAGIDIS